MILSYEFDNKIIELDTNDYDIKEILEQIVCEELNIKDTNDISKLFDYFVGELIEPDEMAGWYKDELKDYFEETAYEKLQEELELDKFSPLEQVGMHQSDFI